MCEVDSPTNDETTRERPASNLGDEDRRQIMDVLPIPMFVVRTGDDVLMFANRRLCELMDVRPERAQNRKWDAIFHRPKDQQRLRAACRANGAVNGEEVRIRRKDGTPVWFAVWPRRFVCHDTECQLVVLVDITAQKKQEQRANTLQSLVDISEHDRKLVAYEIHDGVIQDIAGALMHLQAVRMSLEQGTGDPLDQLDKIARILRDGMEEARRLIDGLSPPDFERTGLFGAMQTLIGKFTETSGVRIDFKYDVASGRLNEKIEAAAYRIVQEALSNVWKHSQSREASVRLTQHTDRLEITVADRGVGFDPDELGDDGKHFGLVGIRQRASLLGGTLTVASGPQAGTKIMVTLPHKSPLTAALART